MLFWLGVVLTALMGVALGLLGGGGSILAVPILVYVFGMQAHAAIALSLVLVGSTALAAAALHHREAYVDWKAGAIFSACAAPVSLLGARAAMQLPGKLLLVLFGALMVVAGAAMWRRREGEDRPHPRHPVVLVLSAALVGFLTGFLGVGGGFLIVPAMVFFLGKPMKHAVGTSLVVIAANCAVAVWGHRSALQMQWNVVVPATIAALAGTAAGTQLAHSFHPRRLRQVFAVFVAALGAVLIAVNWGALLG